MPSITNDLPVLSTSDEAQQRIIHKWEGRLNAFVIKNFGLDSLEAAAAVNETFCYLFNNKWNAQDNRANVQRLLFKVAGWRARDEFRKKKKFDYHPGDPDLLENAINDIREFTQMCIDDRQFFENAKQVLFQDIRSQEPKRAAAEEQVVRLLLEGKTQAEVAKNVGKSVRTIRRYVKDIEKRFAQRDYS